MRDIKQSCLNQMKYVDNYLGILYCEIIYIIDYYSIFSQLNYYRWKSVIRMWPALMVHSTCNNICGHSQDIQFRKCKPEMKYKICNIFRRFSDWAARKKFNEPFALCDMLLQPPMLGGSIKSCKVNRIGRRPAVSARSTAIHSV